MLNTDVYMLVSARPIERKSKKIIDVLFFFTVILTIFTGYKIHGNSLVGISMAVIIVYLLVQNIRLNYREITVIFLFAVYVITILFLSVEKHHILQNLRYWFGILFYIFLFKSYNYTKLITFGFFRIACFTYLMEAFLINTFIESSFLHTETNELNTIFFGFYERPVGFTANPGTTVVFLISYLYFVEIYRGITATFFDLLLITCASILSVSTTAIFVYVVYMLLKYVTFNGLRFYHRVQSILLFVFLIVVPLTYIFLNTSEEELQKYSAEYVEKIFKSSLSTAVSQDYSYFGQQIYMNIPVTSGDIGWVLLLFTTGIVGFCLYFLMLFVFYKNDYKYLPVLFLIHFGSLHYPSAFSSGGQLLTAMILVVRDNSYFRQVQSLKNIYSPK